MSSCYWYVVNQYNLLTAIRSNQPDIDSLDRLPLHTQVLYVSPSSVFGPLLPQAHTLLICQFRSYRHCKTHIRGSGQDVAKAFGAHSATGNAANPVQPVASHWVRRNTSLTYCGTVFGIVHLPDV